MKIRCVLTDSTEYRQFNCFENSIYTLKISRNYKYWYYDLCDLIDFYKDTDIEVISEISNDDLALARKLYGNHQYNERILREYETDVMVHSTTKDNVQSILSDKKLKAWNLLRAEKPYWEQQPIGTLLGDIEDFSNYVMLSGISQNNEIITASKSNGEINTDINQSYVAGARFYLNAQKIAADGLLLRDGAHIKVRDYIDLEKYLIWYSTPEILGIEEHTTPKIFFELSNQKFNEVRGIMIRKIRTNELNELLGLYTHLHEIGVPEDNKNLKKTWDTICNDENHHIIVCEVEGKIVSSCVCVIIPNLTRNIRPYAFIENVVTHADYRGKGYATACLNYAKELAQKADCYKMMLLTGSKSENTLNFYKKAGYNSEDKTAFIQWL